MVLTLLLHRKMFEVSNLLFALFVLYSACGDGLFYTLRAEMVCFILCVWKWFVLYSACGDGLFYTLYVEVLSHHLKMLLCDEPLTPSTNPP